MLKSPLTSVLKSKCCSSHGYTNSQFRILIWTNQISQVMFLSTNRNNNKPVHDIKKTKPRIHQFTNSKCYKKTREPFKTLFNGLLFIMYYLKIHFQPCLFILKALKDILQHFKFVKLVNSWFRFFMSWTG